MDRQFAKVNQCLPGMESYEIKSGDNIYKIVQQFRVPLRALLAVNPTIDPYNLRIGQLICIPTQTLFPTCSNGRYYVVQSGDTLYNISIRFGIPLSELISSNSDIDPNRLMIGQIICVPIGTGPMNCPRETITYRIQPEDTLYLLAQRFGTTVNEIMRINSRLNPYMLMVGQRICIPENVNMLGASY